MALGVGEGLLAWCWGLGARGFGGPDRWDGRLGSAGRRHWVGVFGRGSGNYEASHATVVRRSMEDHWACCLAGLYR